MSNFGEPPLFVVSVRQYAVIMSVEDSSPSFSSMTFLEDQFRQWIPFDYVNTPSANSSSYQIYQDYPSTASAQPNYINIFPDQENYTAPQVWQNFRPSAFNNNYNNASGFSENSQSFGEVGDDRVMAEFAASSVDTGLKKQSSSYIELPYGNKKPETVVPNHSYEKQNFVSFNGQGSRFQASNSQDFINVQNGYNPGYAAENYYSACVVESTSSSNFIVSPIHSRISVGKVSRPCGFCRKNGESPEFFENHELKDSKGNVTCPILSAHSCEVCSATGEKAHTVSYCPVLKAFAQKPLKSAACLKETMRDSSGRIRSQYFKR